MRTEGRRRNQDQVSGDNTVKTSLTETFKAEMGYPSIRMLYI